MIENIDYTYLALSSFPIAVLYYLIKRIDKYEEPMNELNKKIDEASRRMEILTIKKTKI